MTTGGHHFRLLMLINDGGTPILINILAQKVKDEYNKDINEWLKDEEKAIKSLIGYHGNDLYPPSGKLPTTSDLDITIIAQLLRNCFKMKIDFSSEKPPLPTDVSVEAGIWQLKEYRNKICHKSKTGIQENVYKAWRNDIAQILVRLDPNIQQSLAYYETCPLDEEREMKRTEKETQKWKEEMYQERKTKLKEHLIKFYKNKRSTVPLSPLVEEKVTPLAGFYVMPNMVMVKQTSHTSHQEEKTPINSLTDLFITGSEDQQEIYLSADAGFGKTSFSKYLAITWVQACCPDSYQKCFKPEELNALANFEFVFLVLLRDSTAVCNIDEMIEQQIIKKIPPQASQCPLHEVLEREKCLIILDGLDEWTHPDNGCSQQKEKIPHRYSRDNCVILTTTRPWKLGDSNLKTSDINKKVEFVQLSKDSTRQLEKNAIRKMADVNDDGKLMIKTQKFDEVIEDRGLEHMQAIPLLLMYIICLWCNNIPIGSSKVEVYINIIEFLLSRTAQKHPEFFPSSEPSHSDIPEYFMKHKFCEKFYSLLTALAELAYHALFNEERENTLVFDESVAENYLKADDMKFSLLSGILTGSTTTTLIERKSKFSFSHKTVQEFFAAIFISSQKEGQKLVLENCKNVQSILDMSMICEFVNKLNNKMMYEISAGFMPVINEDEETREYRTRACDEYVKDNSLYYIQKMLLSCLSETSALENIKLCFQDLFIYGDGERDLKRLTKLNKNNLKSLYIYTRASTIRLHEIMAQFSLSDLNFLQKLYYEGDGDDAGITCLLLPSLESLSLIGERADYKRNLINCVEKMHNLQYLYIRDFTFSHVILEIFLNFISSKSTLKEIMLSRLFCKEHHRNCERMKLDFSKHSDLTKVALELLPPLELIITSPSLVDVCLSDMNLGERSVLLSLEMQHIERVELKHIEMSGECFQSNLNVLDKLPQSVTVSVEECCIQNFCFEIVNFCCDRSVPVSANQSESRKRKEYEGGHLKFQIKRLYEKK